VAKGWSSNDVRRLLRRRGGGAIECDPLGVALRKASSARSAAAALESLVQQVVAESPGLAPYFAYDRGAVEERARAVHYSRRHYLRRRRAAIELLAREIDRRLARAKTEPPALAAYERLGSERRPDFALAAIRLRLRNALPVGERELSACTDQYRILAHVAIARDADARGNKPLLDEMFARIRMDLRSLGRRVPARVAFECFELERFDIRRRCDFVAARKNLEILTELGAGIPSLRFRAALAEAEAACVWNELDHAKAVLARCREAAELRFGAEAFAMLTWVEALIAFSSKDACAARGYAEQASTLLEPLHAGLAQRALALAGRAALKCAEVWDVAPHADESSWYLADVFSTKARFALAREQPREALGLAHHALDLARRTRADAAAAFAASSLARVQRRLGMRREATAYEAVARDLLARTGGNTVYAADL